MEQVQASNTATNSTAIKAEAISCEGEVSRSEKLYRRRLEVLSNMYLILGFDLRHLFDNSSLGCDFKKPTTLILMSLKA